MYLTPGATTKATKADVCGPEELKAKPVTSFQRSDALKRYGKDPNRFSGDLDFLIPQALGGSSDPDNLWPIPSEVVEKKRKLETTLRQMVCDDKMPLKDAQKAIRKDWLKAYDEYVK